MSSRDKIKNLNFFSTLNDEQLDILLGISLIETYDKDSVLYYEKTSSHKVIFLIKGLAKAFKIDKHDNEIFLYYIENNNIISDISSMDSDILSSYSNISFVENSQILSIDYKKFKAKFLNNNILIKEFASEIIIRTQKLESLISREFIFDAVTKVAIMIDTNLTMFNKLKRHDIALILHIQPATLSRVLNRLKKNNIIDIIHGCVSVIDKQNLETIYKEL